MRWDVFAWGAAALLLFAAEALAPGAFMLWLGFAAVVVFVAVLLVPGMSLLAQVAAFVVLSFVSIQIYRTWFRGRERQSDQPMLNRRGQSYIGRNFTLKDPIVNGVGKLRVDDSQWRITGPDVPAGTQVKVTRADGATLHVESV